MPTEPIAALRAQQVMGFVAGRYNHRLDAPRLPPWSEVLKTRLLGAAVIIALAVLFIPMFFSSAPPATVGDQAVSLTIPDSPDRDLQTKTMSLAVPPANTPAATVPGTVTPATPAASGDQLATVNIGSNRPRDVETDPEAGKPRTPTTVTMGSGTSPEQPVIPLQNKHAAGSAQTTPAANAKAAPVSKTPAAPVASVQQAAVSKAAVVAVAPATAAAAEHGNYTLNLSAYASAAGAAKLQGQVRALGYPAQSHLIQQAGQQRTLVIAGPFDTRTAAEAARLKITQTIPGAPARLEQNASHSGASVASQSAATTPSTAASKTASTKAGGWAVQLAAMSTQADADALRDKLRAGGFDGFVDSVQANGKQLWRVRAGPQAQRADAVRIHDQIKAKFAIDGNVVSVP